MLRKHNRPAESHIKVNGKTKIIPFVLLKGYMEFYYAFLPFLSETKAQLFIITFLFLPFLLQKNTHSCFVSFFPKREINSLKLLFFPNYKPWMYFFMMEKIIFFTFHLCKKLGWPKVGDTDLSPLNGCEFVSSRM